MAQQYITTAKTQALPDLNYYNASSFFFHFFYIFFFFFFFKYVLLYVRYLGASNDGDDNYFLSKATQRLECVCVCVWGGGIEGGRVRMLRKERRGEKQRGD